jgi:predicted nucleotidyltransferase
LTDTRGYILKTLTYFDMFNYPLLADELFFFHGEPCTRTLFDETLASLITGKTVFCLEGFYGLHNDKGHAENRKKANRLAVEQMIIAKKAAHTLSKFPYVRGLAVSGSLSKNYGSEKADIDFFVITAPGRLWIARTCMHLYKKLTYLTGRHNWYCMNYYVDEAMPEIEEKNIFTATETVTLLPMYGRRPIHGRLNGSHSTPSSLKVSLK